MVGSSWITILKSTCNILLLVKGKTLSTWVLQAKSTKHLQNPLEEKCWIYSSDKPQFQIKNICNVSTFKFMPRSQAWTADDVFFGCVHLLNVQMKIIFSSGFDFDFWHTGTFYTPPPAHLWQTDNNIFSRFDVCIALRATASATRENTICAYNIPHLHLGTCSSCLSTLAFQMTCTRKKLTEDL